MTPSWPFADSLLSGPLCSSLPWPCNLHVRLGDLQPRFRVKQTVRCGCRAIGRDGRILLCTDRSLEDLCGRRVRLRLQTWHRRILSGEVAAPYGILVSVRGDDRANFPSLFTAELRRHAEADGELRLEVGGGMVLDFRRLIQN
jgi:hypothetical protein